MYPAVLFIITLQGLSLHLEHRKKHDEPIGIQIRGPNIRRDRLEEWYNGDIFGMNPFRLPAPLSAIIIDFSVFYKSLGEWRDGATRIGHGCLLPSYHSVSSSNLIDAV